MTFKEKVVLITGTSRGIGLGLAQSFLADGHFVVGCSRQDSDLTHERYEHVQVDITDEAAVTNYVAAIAQAHGRIDLLVNNAGTHLASPALLTPVDQVKSVMDVNFFAAYHMCTAVGKMMVQQRYGRIINLSSIATTMLAQGTTAYTASKAALSSFSEILAKELAPFGITCNVVNVSIVDTEMSKKLSEQEREQVLSRLTVKQYAEMADIYRAILFFASSDGTGVTGQALNVGF